MRVRTDQEVYRNQWGTYSLYRQCTRTTNQTAQAQPHQLTFQVFCCSGSPAEFTCPVFHQSLRTFLLWAPSCPLYLLKCSSILKSLDVWIKHPCLQNALPSISYQHELLLTVESHLLIYSACVIGLPGNHQPVYTDSSLTKSLGFFVAWLVSCSVSRLSRSLHYWSTV